MQTRADNRYVKTGGGKMRGRYEQKLEYGSVKYIENEIKCPYCDYLFSDSWEYNTEDMEWSDIIKCPTCSKKFCATKCVSIEYHTEMDCKLNNEEHEFEKSWAVKDMLECKKCGWNKLEVIK